MKDSLVKPLQCGLCSVYFMLAFWQEEIGTLRKLTRLWDCIVANRRKDRTRMDEAELRRRLRQPDAAKRADLIRLGRER